MAYTLGFGKHEGKSLEWLFFNAPAYIEWIMKKDIHNDASKFSALPLTSKKLLLNHPCNQGSTGSL